jgi:DeoR/GlpR family transcriptional regulator of sugar metabolism
MLQLEKMNERQKLIIEFAKKREYFQTKDVLDFFVGKISVERITVIRDLSFLVSENILEQE